MERLFTFNSLPLDGGDANVGDVSSFFYSQAPNIERLVSEALAEHGYVILFITLAI